MYVTKLPKYRAPKKPIGRGSLALAAPGLALLLIAMLFVTIALVANRPDIDRETFIHSQEFNTIMWAFIVPITIVLSLGIWLGKRHGYEHRFATLGQYISMSLLGLFLFATLFTLFMLIPALYREVNWETDWQEWFIRD